MPFPPSARITSDGTSPWPVEPGRYRLVVNRACPFSGRVLVVRRLVGLEAALPVAVTDPLHDDRGWRFTLDPEGHDPVLGIRYLAEAYEAAAPGYDGGVSVPAVVDVPGGRVVTNDHDTLTRDLATQWRHLHRPGAPDLYPAELRADIDALNSELADDVFFGVYTCGFAKTQEEYSAAFRRLFDRLDVLEERLRTRRYLHGDTITESDIRLFTTLVRFDAAYHGLFRCNRNKLTEMPVLWAYMRDLFQTPGFGDTVHFADIKLHYHAVLTELNPRGIVPEGPDLSVWHTPHNRERLGGRPFGDGTPPPAAT
ncbi:putative glutathione S-transferase [Nocardiopsis mwathae]|uniref:Putative glutathione S-transferase n=1 Tax=Nocardiopsis mwathae TaxID=1472723 RepID=A0A7W9YM18_9ACTN|nr:glutathione S-transferase C-terminal domain-containing protein [Nocardiopsis mwathae]MBB6174547.1 putative glutathione S-transferase [Nocardiopsis mwathae]